MLLFPLSGMICGGYESETTQKTSSSVAFYPTGKKPPPLTQKNATPARLCQSPYMKGVALVDYAIQVTIDTDNRLVTDSSSKSAYQNSSHSSGSIKYIPRISISAKNNPLPKSCLLVIEYFTQDPASKTTNCRKCVEHISLPDIGKGELVTVDANGVEFYKWEHKTKSLSGGNYKHGGGLVLYGVIVSIFNDDKILIQMCTPQPLSKEFADTIPATQAYDDSR